jgi:hypothetical protein
MSAPEWKAIRTWAVAEIDHARDRNESPALTEQQTAALRGRIAALRELLALGEPKAGPARPAPASGPAVTGGPFDRYSS